MRLFNLRVYVAALSVTASIVHAGAQFTAGGGLGGDAPSSGAYYPQYRTEYSPHAVANNGTSIANARHYVAGGNSLPTAVRTVPGIDGAVELSSASTGSAYQIASNGVATGSFQPAGSPNLRAVRWNADGTPTSLSIAETYGEGSSGFSVGIGVNAAGAVVGFTQPAYDSPYPYRWAANATQGVRLSGPTSNTAKYGGGVAVGVSAGGTAIGVLARSDVAGNDLGLRAIRWSSSSNVGFELGNLGTRDDGYTISSAQAINAAGVVVGSCETFEGATGLGERAVRWNVGSSAAVRLETLGTDPNGVSFSRAFSINDTGQAAGGADLYDAFANRVGRRAVRWDAAGHATALNAAGTYEESDGLSINARGTVAGASYRTVNNSDNRATIWLANSALALDLNTLLPGNLRDLWTLKEAVSVSDTGFVVGNARFDPDGAAGPIRGYQRTYTLLVPKAGTYGDGDATFDTLVNFDDLLALARHYGQSNAALRHDVADFDLDGTVNFDDLLTLARHYGGTAAMTATTTESFAADWALAQSLVPEPSALLAIGVGAVAASRRGRRDHA